MLYGQWYTMLQASYISVFLFCSVHGYWYQSTRGFRPGMYTEAVLRTLALLVLSSVISRQPHTPVYFFLLILSSPHSHTPSDWRRGAPIGYGCRPFRQAWPPLRALQVTLFFSFNPRQPHLRRLLLCFCAVSAYDLTSSKTQSSVSKR